MSFMYNPFPYDDPRPVNRPVLPKEAIDGLFTGGTSKVASVLAGRIAEMMDGKGSVVVAFDGYTTADFTRIVNLLSQQLQVRGLSVREKNFADVYKDEAEFKALIDDQLWWDRSVDPTLLFGRIYKGGYEGLIDKARLEAFDADLRKGGEVTIVYGYGCLIAPQRVCYDLTCYLDITPKESILRIRRGAYVNLGLKNPQPVPLTIRRCYYADFEVAVHLRADLLKNNLLDYYFEADHLDDLKMMTGEAIKLILSSLAAYPFRCKPAYIEGVWGGSYIKRLRHLPDTMRNCAWVFDLIPMEVSVLVEVGETIVEIPFCSFFMKEGEAVMGKACVDKFHGYFPIRFNYDDSFHSTGNMSIQCHSGAKFNIDNFGEFGRQDESYYVVATGHGAKTFIGFRDDADLPQFFKDIQAADKDHVPVDYMKYVSYEDSKPGLQVMLPAGTIHSSGRNQVVLEIGSLTIGSYTYKMYDYLRLDFDGKQRPIHTKLGEENVAKDRRTTWVRNNIVQQPRKVREGDGWAEYIVGEHDLLYFSLRRYEFEHTCEGDTEGKFHVLVLVDGDKIRIRSKAHPERYYDADYLDMVVVPADLGEYVIENLGKEPVCVHKTMLKDGFENEPA